MLNMATKEKYRKIILFAWGRITIIEQVIHKF